MEGVVAYDTGLTNVEGKITSDRAEETGTLVENQITGKGFS